MFKMNVSVQSIKASAEEKRGEMTGGKADTGAKKKKRAINSFGV